MEDMDFGWTSIDELTITLSDGSTEKLTYASLQIDGTPPEAGKFSLTIHTNDLTIHTNEEVVLAESKGQLSNAINQIINEQRTAIPVKINLILNKDEETKLPLQDYLNPSRTCSNRSAIMLPKDDTKKSGLNLKYLILVRQNSFRGTISEHPHDHIKNLEEIMMDEYNRCKLFSFSLEGDARKWLDQLPAGSLTCWKEIRSVFINHFFD